MARPIVQTVATVRILSKRAFKARVRSASLSSVLKIQQDKGAEQTRREGRKKGCENRVKQSIRAKITGDLGKNIEGKAAANPAKDESIADLIHRLKQLQPLQF